MDDDLKRKASGRTLEILQNKWKSECEKDEKKSLDKWRYKEIWLLDYVRRYGNNTTKEKESKRIKETAHKRDDHQRQKITQVTLGTKANLKKKLVYAYNNGFKLYCCIQRRNCSTQRYGLQ